MRSAGAGIVTRVGELVVRPRAKYLVLDQQQLLLGVEPGWPNAAKLAFGVAPQRGSSVALLWSPEGER